MREKRKRRALIKPHGFIHPSVASAVQCHSLTADGGETMRSTVAHVSADSTGEGGHRKCHDCLLVCSNVELCPCQGKQPRCTAVQPEVLGDRVGPVADGDRQRRTDKDALSPPLHTPSCKYPFQFTFIIFHQLGLTLNSILEKYCNNFSFLREGGHMMLTRAQYFRVKLLLQKHYTDSHTQCSAAREAGLNRRDYQAGWLQNGGDPGQLSIFLLCSSTLMVN